MTEPSSPTPQERRSEPLSGPEATAGSLLLVLGGLAVLFWLVAVIDANFSLRSWAIAIAYVLFGVAEIVAGILVIQRKPAGTILGIGLALVGSTFSFLSLLRGGVASSVMLNLGFLGMNLVVIVSLLRASRAPSA